jgi:two-component system phosphate regulon sensor histidine kinase PhoR
LRRRIFFKLIVAVISVLIVALIAVDFLASRVAESSYKITLKRELADKARMLSELNDPGWRDSDRVAFSHLAQAAGARLTLIASDGRVIKDSDAEAARMENHRNRPEVLAALDGRTGESTRRSPTIGVDFLYVAVPVDGMALRLAVPLADIHTQVNALRRQMLASTVIAFLPAVIVAALIARYASSRLAAIIDYAGELATGNFRAELKRKGADELGVLGEKLTETGAKLQRMFEELQREHIELEKLERIRKDFVINVSHELRTPLASIQGYTETLLEGALHDSEHNVRFLTIIRQNAERLGRLIADIMTLSRIELKTQQFQLASYCANGLIAQSRDSIQPMAEKKNITIHTEPAPPEVEVFCDAEAVHQILGNLLDNAVKYTSPGGAITMGARRAPALAGNQELVEFFVRDTGIGIPKEDLPRLFERFYRVDKARSRELGGTGLGLSIVKHLARAMGGEVRVESEPNKGSTFSFTLPVHDLGLLDYARVQTELTKL